MRVPPRAKLPMSPDQALTPPFIVSQSPTLLQLWDIPTLAEAVDEFVRYGLPPNDTPGGCVVIDSNGVVAIGYGGPPLFWAGTRVAIEILRQHPLVEPLLMASIEIALEPA
jgi:hypothetical protein